MLLSLLSILLDCSLDGRCRRKAFFKMSFLCWGVMTCLGASWSWNLATSRFPTLETWTLKLSLIKIIRLGSMRVKYYAKLVAFISRRFRFNLNNLELESSHFMVSHSWDCRIKFAILDCVYDIQICTLKNLNPCH